MRSAGAWLFALLALAGCASRAAPHAAPVTERVVIDLAGGPVARFAPDRAFGAVIDGLYQGRIDQTYTASNIRALKTAGFGATIYNLRTELGIEAWHWTDRGRWSDAVHRQGYWIGDQRTDHPLRKAWGYFLPRRGDSIDQANDEGYSRIDDGNPASFWKSNPWLDPAYAQPGDARQWVVVHFDGPVAVSAARILWGLPYAARFAVQYWPGDDEQDPDGHWITLAEGRGTDGAQLLRLAPRPVSAQFFRILLERSSHVAPMGSRDRRDAMGYALRELGLGTLDAAGRFHDRIVHRREGHEQTQIYVSSTDPWHRARDRDPTTEQLGFDRIFSSGLTNGQPVMLNVGALYDTPDNTAAELRYFTAHHYPLRAVEIGLEPDGQFVPADDFADLFMQTAAAVRAVDPRVPIAGPGLEDAVTETWLDAHRDHSWNRLFIAALRRAHRLGDLNIFTFEHYPFDEACGAIDAKLREEDGKLAQGMRQLDADGVPPALPRSIIEYGFSAFSGAVAMQLPEALYEADMLAHFLTLGGTSTYFLGYGPEELYDPENACAGYGELMLFGEDARGRATWPTPAYWGARLVTQDWVQPGDAAHLLYRAQWQGAAGPRDLVASYALRRPDGHLSVLLINRDPGHAHVVSFAARGAAGVQAIAGPLDVVQYGPAQYHWQAAGPDGHPSRDEPPRHFTARGSLVLPAYSLTIARI